MARGHVSGIAALLGALAIAGCARAESLDAAHAPTTVPATTTSSRTPTTTSSTTTTTTPLAEIDAVVTIPEGDGPFPVVVLVHGGSWVAGDPSLLQPLANHLADAGYLTVNIRYSLSTLDRPGFPQAVEDVACAVRYAARHPDSDGTVAVVGHSAGAQIGAVVALTGDTHADRCEINGPGVPERFVGLAGPYDVSRLALPLAVFFGGTPDQIPEAWEAGNPQRLTDENPGLDSLIMYGERDGFVPDSFAFNFHDALVESGSKSHVEMIPGARHNDLHDPGLVGDLIATWLDRRR